MNPPVISSSVVRMVRAVARSARTARMDLSVARVPRMPAGTPQAKPMTATKAEPPDTNHAARHPAAELTRLAIGSARTSDAVRPVNTTDKAAGRGRPGAARGGWLALDPASFRAWSSAATALAAAAGKKPSYRVLEDPYAEAPLEAAAASKGPKAPNYRVLEDPMTTAMYDPSTSSEAVSASAVTSAMPGSSRPPASEVLEGAREKFDKFWGSKPRNNTTSDNNEP